jgi:hypothetical protein
MPDYDPERVVTEAIEHHANGDPAALARAILNRLWEAGYDVRPRPNMIPIRYNPALPTGYSVDDERRAADMAPADLFRALADDPRNAPIADKITEIAKKFDEYPPDLKR